MRSRLPTMADSHPLTPCADPAATLPDADVTAGLAEVLKALADPTRLRLLGYVAAAPGGTVCACHLTGELGIAQPTLSHHLKKLVDAGILTREQRGRWAHYTVVAGSLTPALAFLASADPASPPSTSTPG